MSMAQHIEEFKRDGYTVFDGLFGLEQIEQWKTSFENLLKHQPPLTDKKRAPELGESHRIVGMVLEYPPENLLRALHLAAGQQGLAQGVGGISSHSGVVEQTGNLRDRRTGGDDRHRARGAARGRAGRGVRRALARGVERRRTRSRAGRGYQRAPTDP